MAQAAECQTPGAVFHTKIHGREVKVSVKLPFNLELSDEEAEVLDANMHNALELVLARYFVQR